MNKLYRARWVLPISSAPIPEGAIVVSGDQIVAVGKYSDLLPKFSGTPVNDSGEAALLPGLVNAHTHLELTAMRGFLEAEESDFFAWLRKLTTARLERMSADDLYVSAAWGACEAARAGVTCVGDASDAADESMRALSDTGLRGTVYQESFGPDARLAGENFAKLKRKVARLRELETSLLRAGVSPHAPYTVCSAQLELISEFALAEKLPLMMHVAESRAEDLLLREGSGPFARNLAERGIPWTAPGCSTVHYLAQHGIMNTKPLLTHCIHVDAEDIEAIRESGASIAHCPKSNAKLGHGRAPFARFLKAGIPLGFGSDSVASNNTCDILEEARFAVLLARADPDLGAALDQLGSSDALRAATVGGAQALDWDEHIGVLEGGRQADFIAVSLEGAHQLPAYEPEGTLVFASGGSDVIMTVVAGSEVYRDGRVTTIDEDRLRGRMKEIAIKLGAPV